VPQMKKLEQLVQKSCTRAMSKRLLCPCVGRTTKRKPWVCMGAGVQGLDNDLFFPLSYARLTYAPHFDHPK